MRYAVIALLLCVATRSALTARADVVSALLVDEASVVIHVPVNIVGVGEDVLARWRDAIDRVWNYGNDGRPFSVCGREVRFDPTFTPVAVAQPSRDSHLVVVRDIREGEQYVSSVWHALGTSPAYSPRIGYWGSHMNGETAAHEFGHLLGLLDEYVENDANENGLREPGERPVPDVKRYPDAWFSLMAGERGVVLRRHVRDVIRMHGGGDALVCGARPRE